MSSIETKDNLKHELNIGVIGTGGRGRLADIAHCPAEGVRVVAGADINSEALEKFKGKFGNDAFVTEDYNKLLARKDIDAVFVTSPDFLHEEHAVAALEHGKHVYLEKPMAITIDGCDRILRTAYKKKLKLYLGHNMRHMSFVLQMKELIDSGAIGDVKAGWCRHFVGYGGDAYFKDWHAERKKTMSLLLQKGAHDIDILHWLCKGYTETVTALGGETLYCQIADRRDPSEAPNTSWHDENWPPLSQKKLNPTVDVEDLNMMLMKLDNGVFASYQQCHYTPDSWRNYCIIGTEGRIENFGDAPGRCVINIWNHREEYNPAGHEQCVIPAEKGTHGGADIKIVTEFIGYINGAGKIKTSAIAARNSVAAGYMAAYSLRNGGIPVNIPPLAKEITEYFNTDVE